MCTGTVLVFIALFLATSGVLDEKYCKPGQKWNDGRTCRRCPRCKIGEETNKTSLVIDDNLGALNCYECTPCPPGTYSNKNTRVGRVIQCVEWRNCTEEGRVYAIVPNNKRKGECGKCLDGYFRGDSSLFDHYCQRCSWEHREKENCKNMNLTEPIKEDSPSQSSKYPTNFGDVKENKIKKAVNGFHDSAETFIIATPLTFVVLVVVSVSVTYVYYRKRRNANLHGRCSNSAETQDLPLLGNIGEVNIIEPLRDVQISVGQDLKLVCVVSSPCRNLQWKKNDILLTREDCNRPNFSIDENIHTLIIKSTTRNDMGEYSCIVEGKVTKAIVIVEENFCLTEYEQRFCKQRFLTKNCEAISLVLSRAVTDQDLLYGNLLYGKEHEIIRIKEETEHDLKQQTCQILYRWIEVRGKNATMYELYLSVFKVYKCLLDIRKKDSISLYAQLLNELKYHVQQDLTNSQTNNSCYVAIPCSEVCSRETKVYETNSDISTSVL